MYDITGWRKTDSYCIKKHFFLYLCRNFSPISAAVVFLSFRKEMHFLALNTTGRNPYTIRIYGHNETSS